MWAVWIVLCLFLVACACVVSAIYRHDGPMWAGVFLALLLCAVIFM